MTRPHVLNVVPNEKKQVHHRGAQCGLRLQHLMDRSLQRNKSGKMYSNKTHRAYSLFDALMDAVYFFILPLCLVGICS